QAEVVNITMADDTLTNAASVDFKITFSQPVRVEDLSTVAIKTGGTVTTDSTVTVSDGENLGSIHTITVTNIANDGELGIEIGTRAFADSRGLALKAPASSGQYLIDNTPPAITGTIPETSSFTGKSAFTIAIAFSEKVQDADPSALSITPEEIADPEKLELHGDTLHLPVEIPEHLLLEQVPVKISFSDGLVVDKAGNTYAGADEFTITYDGRPLTVTGFSPDIENGQTTARQFQVTLVFCRPVFGFDKGDILIDNAKISGFEGADGDTEYFVTVVPAEDGPVRLTVPEGAAHDHVNNPNESSVAFTVLYSKPPAKITLLLPEDGASRQRLQPRFSWQHEDHAETYELQLAKNPDFRSEDQVITIENIPGPEFSMEDHLGHDQTWYWRVRGNNHGVTGAWSETRSFATLREKPAQVILIAPEDSAGAVQTDPELKWKETARANRYRVEITENDDFDHPLFVAHGIAATSVPLEDILESYAKYQWRVRGENEAGNGSWSVPGVFVTKADIPELLFPAQNATLISIAPQLSWETAHPDSKFELRLGSDPHLREQIQVYQIQATHFEPDSLQADTDYYWQVRLADRLTHSDWSEIRRFTTRPDPAEEKVAVTFQFVPGESENGEWGYYNLIGLPGSQILFLDDIFGKEQSGHWSAFMETGGDAGFLVPFDQESNRFCFRPGRGHWIHHEDSVRVELKPVPARTDRDDAFAIEVQSGWNIITNPFTSAVSWMEMMAYNDLNAPLYGYSRTFEKRDSLQAFEGFYFYNDPEWQLDSLKVPFVTTARRRFTDPGQKTAAEQLSEYSGEGANMELQALFAEADDRSPFSKAVRLNFGSGHQDVPYPPLDMTRYGLALVSGNAADMDDMSPGKTADQERYAMSSQEISGQSGLEFSGSQELLLRSRSAAYKPTGEKFLLEVKAPRGTGIEWKARFRGIGNQAVILIHDPADDRFVLMGSGETAGWKVKERHSTYHVYVGDEAAIMDVMDRMAPGEIVLKQNYPNPFNPSTTIRYSVVEETDVRLEVFDILGRHVRTLANGVHQNGWYSVSFDGSGLASGVYIYRLVAGPEILTGQMMLIN
ncbi:T9SS type A sorting domain-containing protein, partial [Balneolales bacterium ANBcel1]|nr:T9SS type A sorting domain-containing protein [Balneolales bacterium ANBcel1]